MAVTITMTQTDPLALGKCISLHDPARYEDVDRLGVDCYYTWRLPADPLPTKAKRIAMIWGLSLAETVLNNPAILDDYDTILLFNECDTTDNSQCIATPLEAAEMTLRLQAVLPNKVWISPAVHNWGVAGWLDQYLDFCTECQIDGIAIHYYSWEPCNTSQFRAYINSFDRFNKPILVTEYGCMSPIEANRLYFYKEWYNILKNKDNVLAVFPWTSSLPDTWPIEWRWGSFIDNSNELTALGAWYTEEGWR